MAFPDNITEWVRIQEGGASASPLDRASADVLPLQLNGVHTNKGIRWIVFIEVLYKGLTPKAAKALPTDKLTTMCERFLNLSDDDWIAIWVTFWDAIGGDDLDNQQVADYLVYWGWHAGRTRPARALQQTLNAMGARPALKVDGKVGPKTVAAANAVNQQRLLVNLIAIRSNQLRNFFVGYPDQIPHLAGFFNTNSYLLLATLGIYPLPT